MTLLPKFRLIGPEGVPEGTAMPFTVIVAPASVAVGVTVTVSLPGGAVAV